jgi:hypothetical protein
LTIYTKRISVIKDFVNEQQLNFKILNDRKSVIIIEKGEADIVLKGAIGARDVINALAQKTLTLLSTQIGQLVTDAIHAVFDNPYTFKMGFVNRRNQTECDLSVVRNNVDRHPLSSNGGGLADVISTALRSTFLVLSEVRPVLILDEPFKFLSEDLQSYCCIMLKTISDQLGIQIIMVSHLNEMREIADNIINVTQTDGVSFIKKVC